MPPKSKLAACIHCRQMKLRCDAHDTFPASCTRCEKRNLRCSIDPSFRRTAKRERVASLEQELQRLRENVESGISPPKSSVHDNGSTPEEASQSQGQSQSQMVASLQNSATVSETRRHRTPSSLVSSTVNARFEKLHNTSLSSHSVIRY